MILAGTFLVVGALGLGVYLAANKNRFSPQTNQQTAQTTLTPTPPTLATWDDPAGFTFTYPDGLSVNKHDEDTNNYAHIELTHKDHPGSVIVWAKDTTSADVQAWATTEKQFAGSTMIDTTLGGKAAKKISFSPNKRIVGTIYDDLLFTVDATLDDQAYWEKVVDVIANSFTFKPVGAASGVDTVGGASVDEEEVVQ